MVFEDRTPNGAQTQVYLAVDTGGHVVTIEYTRPNHFYLVYRSANFIGARTYLDTARNDTRTGRMKLNENFGDALRDARDTFPHLKTHIDKLLE
jgi:hypothetical protein